MADLYEIVGEDFFKPLTSVYKSIYWQCILIIYDSYRTELSYGIDREHLAQKLEYYFDTFGQDEMQFDDNPQVFKDAKSKAAEILRRLKACRWIEYEIGSDQRTKVLMPSHAVSIVKNLQAVSSGRETEYQSELSAIYSLLTNPELMNDPYLQIIKPVFDRTTDLFTALKQLNSSIKKYIDALTVDKTAEEIIANFDKYYSEIGSKAFHRLYTSNNVSRFRNVILSKLSDFLIDNSNLERVVWGYQRVEGESSLDEARDKTRAIITEIIDYFRAYDDIVKEIETKHARYLSSTVRRARFLLMNTNNTEGKVSTILRYMSDMFNHDEENWLEDDAPDDLCTLFNIFTQGFVNNESIKTMPISRKITDVDDIFTPIRLSEEERKALRLDAYRKNKNRFSRKNITEYVESQLKNKDSLMASEISIGSKRDMIRVIFISLYGQSGKNSYQVLPKENIIEKQGFVYHDFEIRRRKT